MYWRMRVVMRLILFNMDIIKSRPRLPGSCSQKKAVNSSHRWVQTRSTGSCGQFYHDNGLYKVILCIKLFSFDQYAPFINALKDVDPRGCQQSVCLTEKVSAVLRIKICIESLLRKTRLSTGERTSTVIILQNVFFGTKFS